MKTKSKTKAAPSFRSVHISREPGEHIRREPIAEDMGVELVLPSGDVLVLRYSEDHDALEVRAPEGRVVVVPACANEVFVRVERF